MSRHVERPGKLAGAVRRRLRNEGLSCGPKDEPIINRLIVFALNGDQRLERSLEREHRKQARKARLLCHLYDLHFSELKEKDWPSLTGSRRLLFEETLVCIGKKYRGSHPKDIARQIALVRSTLQLRH